MADNQIIKLKKEIELLRDHNAQLKLQLEEQALQLGEMETQHLNIMNKNLMLEEEQKIARDSAQLQKIIEGALSEEKATTEKYKIQADILKEELQKYIQRLKESEAYIQRLQQDNTRLKKDLVEFGQKHEAQDYIDQIRQKERDIQKIGEERENMVRDWNELCDKMEEVLRENRVLRQIADVPENFGIDISKINMGDRIKLEDYKVKIRILQHEVDQLEEERAKLKYRIEFLANSLQSKEEPFSLLTKEQKVELAKFAQRLYEGKEVPDTDKYDFIRQLRQKDEIIKNLENDISIYRAQLQNKHIPSGIGKLSNIDMKEVISMIKDNQKEMIKMINSKNFSGNNQNITNTTNNNINNIGETGNINNINQTGNINVNSKDNKTVLKTTNIGQKLGLSNTNINNLDNKYLTSFKTINEGNENSENINDDIKIVYNPQQLPPVPIYNQKNLDKTYLAQTFKFFSQYKIDINLFNDLFGMPNDVNNINDLKVHALALQTQLIELLEIEIRRNNNDKNLNNNLKILFNKYENVALILKNIFQRYMETKNNFQEKEQQLNKKIDDLNTELIIFKTKNRMYEDEIRLMKPDPKAEKNKVYEELKQEYLDILKRNAILETDLTKLKRKYLSLVEEERKLREYVEMNDKYNIEKEKDMKVTIAKLKEWKSLLMYYLRFLNDKLKKSVDKERFDLLYDENKYLREKNSELTLRDISVTKEMIQTQTLMLKYKDLEDSYFNMQEGKYDAEIELGYLKKRLQELDPNFYNEQNAFRKLVAKLSLLNLSFEQIKNAFIQQPNSENKKENRKINGNINDDLYFLKGLNSSNSYITKWDFEQCLRNNLGISQSDISKADLFLIYRVLNCEDEKMVDIRKFMKQIEICSISEHTKQNSELEIFEKLIKCVQEKNRSLLETFAYYDTNNNGCITREEFVYALTQLGFLVSDENINRLIFLVSGENPVDTEINIHKLDNNDNFNYIEFCELFEQKAKNLLLKNKRTTINKNKEKIDWKVNLLTKIYYAMQNNHIKLDFAFDSFDKTEKGFLSLTEFSSFISHLGIRINADNLKKLFFSFNHDYNVNREVDPNNYFVPTNKIKEELNKISLRAAEYKKLSDTLFVDNSKKVDLNQKYNILLEEQKYYNIRYLDLEKRYNDLMQNNKLLTIQLQDYVKQNNTNIDKYFTTIEELQQLKMEYMSTGIKRADYVKIQTENDSLTREVNILRIGMNTFKELYNACNFKVKQLHFTEARNLDELDTYKKAIRELQGESNTNSLIGKLYYTILICRWREASTLKKYDEALTELNQLKSDNFAMETLNKNLTKDLNDIQSNLQEKIIENIRINDALENYEFGIVGSSPNKEKIYPIDEMKKLVNMLKEDKKKNTEQLLKLRKKVLSLENDKSMLENEIDFCESLADNIRFNNRDEYSQKLIGMSEDIAKLKLNNNILKRENNYAKENTEHTNKIIQQLNQSIEEYEKKNAEWEIKYRKMEEIFHKRDEDRQKKIIEGLENMRIKFKPKQKKIKKINDKNNINNIDNNTEDNKDKNDNDKKSYNGDNDDNNDDMGDNKNDDDDTSSEFTNISLTKNQFKKIQMKEEEINRLNEIIKKKDEEIQRLNKINEENIEAIKKGDEFKETITVENLVGKGGYNIIKNEEKRLMAQTIHQTVKTLQDMIKEKKSQIDYKNKVIDKLHDELSKTKSFYLQKISILEDELKERNKGNLNKLNDLIDEIKNKQPTKFSKNQLTPTIVELENLIAEKDYKIENLIAENKTLKEENQNISLKSNKKINSLEDNIKILELKIKLNDENKIDYDKKLNHLNKEIDSRDILIQNEKEILKELKEKFLHIKENQKFNEKELELSQVSQKQAQSVQMAENIPPVVNDQEKNDLKNEIKKLKSQKNKLNEEKKKLKLEIENLENSKNEVSTQLADSKKEIKQILDLQIKDNKKISILNKEKEKLKKENNRLKEDFEQMKIRLDVVEQENQKLLAINNNLEQELKLRPKPGARPPSAKKEKKKPILNQEKQMRGSYTGSSDDIINNLCEYCIKKNINLKKHLERYDISKNGKIGENDFKRAIEELKIGFISYDLDKLANLCKSSNSKDILIENFLNILKNKNDNFKNFMDNLPEDSNKIIPDKKFTEKYDRFENNEFNVDY